VYGAVALAVMLQGRADAQTDQNAHAEPPPRATPASEPAAPEAPAMPGTEQDAREHFRAGIAHFNAGRYAEAELDFSRGYALSHKPGFLWNMAESARSAGATERALALYRQYLAEAEPDAPRIEAAREWIATLERQHPANALAPRSVAAATGAGATETSAFVPSRSEPLHDDTAIYEEWWFWAGAGVLAAAGVVTAVLLTRPEDEHAEVPEGPLVVRWDM
jgi:tetratricopeptide (TPR) repeat protein